MKQYLFVPATFTQSDQQFSAAVPTPPLLCLGYSQRDDHQNSHNTLYWLLTVASTAEWKEGLLLAEYWLFIFVIDHRFYERKID